MPLGQGFYGVSGNCCSLFIRSPGRVYFFHEKSGRKSQQRKLFPQFARNQKCFIFLMPPRPSVFLFLYLYSIRSAIRRPSNHPLERLRGPIFEPETGGLETVFTRRHEFHAANGCPVSLKTNHDKKMQVTGLYIVIIESQLEMSTY